jgi:hypothetical protein
MKYRTAVFLGIETSVIVMKSVSKVLGKISRSNS